MMDIENNWEQSREKEKEREKERERERERKYSCMRNVDINIIHFIDLSNNGQIRCYPS
jgi:hypothetical protein